MDASQYKEFVLTMLFMKYVSDKYKGDPYGMIVVPEGASFDDMKRFEPAMRFLLDTYIRAEPSEILVDIDDLGLVDLIVKKGADALNDLPEGIRKSQENTAETIENNVRRTIVDENPVNP